MILLNLNWNVAVRIRSEIHPHGKSACLGVIVGNNPNSMLTYVEYTSPLLIKMSVGGDSHTLHEMTKLLTNSL